MPNINTGMNYGNIYQSLIDRARDRLPEGYTENHHVVPKCMGGPDTKENLVALYPEEHFFAHLLLVKMFPANDSLVKAVQAMTAGNDLQGRERRKLVGWLRRKHAKLMSVMNAGEGNSQFGTRWAHNPQTGETLKIKGDLPSGWCFGMKPKYSFTCSCGEIVYKKKGKYCKVCWTKERASLAAKLGSSPDNPGHRNGKLKPLLGKVFATDGIQTIMLEKGQPVPEGFKLGRKPYKKRSVS